MREPARDKDWTGSKHDPHIADALRFFRVLVHHEIPTCNSRAQYYNFDGNISFPTRLKFNFTQGLVMEYFVIFRPWHPLVISMYQAPPSPHYPLCCD